MTDLLMTRRLRFCVLAACLLSGLGAAAQQPTFRGTGEAVRVFVTVTDRDGRLVSTLEQSAFEVRDEGKPQPITLFDNTPQPVRLVVMLDVSGSMEGNLPLLRDAIEQLLPRLRPDDRVRLGTFGREVTIGPGFTNDSRELLAALPRSIVPDAPTPLWRAVDEAISAFDQESDERPVILVLSDGKDSGPTGFGQKYTSQAEVIDRARDRGVMVYAVGMQSRSSRQTPPGRRAGGLACRAHREPAGPGSGACCGRHRRRLRRNPLRPGPRCRVCACGRRASRAIPHRLRSAQTRREGTRDRGAGLPARVEAPGPEELRRPAILTASPVPQILPFASAP